MLNKSFISLKLDAQCVIHNNSIHTVNLNTTLAFKERRQPLTIFGFLFVFFLCQTISKHSYRNSDLSCLMSVVPLCQGTKEMGTLADTERPSTAAHLCFKLSTQWKGARKWRNLQMPPSLLLLPLLCPIFLCAPSSPLLLLSHGLSQQWPAVPCFLAEARQRNLFSPISTLAPPALKAFSLLAVTEVPPPWIWFSLCVVTWVRQPF